MIYAFIAFLAFFLGHFLREMKNILLDIRRRVYELREAQKKTERPTTGFAEPMTRAEMAAEMEEERIQLLNE